jgi:hypothetical protein
MHERAKRLLDVDAIEIGENCRQYHRLEDADSIRKDGRGRSEGNNGRRESVRETGRGKRSGSRRSLCGRHEIEVYCSVM